MNKDILCSIQKRDFHHRKAVKSNSPHHWQRFREMRKKINRDVHKAKSTYFTQLIEKAKGYSKEMWNHLKQTFPLKSFERSIGPDVLMKDGVLITEPKSLASCLNDIFTSIGCTLAAPFNVIISNTVKQVTSTTFNLKKLKLILC